jgi:hypothetical protein
MPWLSTSSHWRARPCWMPSASSERSSDQDGCGKELCRTWIQCRNGWCLLLEEFACYLIPVWPAEQDSFCAIHDLIGYLVLLSHCAMHVCISHKRYVVIYLS